MMFFNMKYSIPVFASLFIACFFALCDIETTTMISLLKVDAGTSTPTKAPTFAPTSAPTLSPTKKPTKAPTPTPSNNPTANPSNVPTATPSSNPSNVPTTTPSSNPTNVPTTTPSFNPTANPTAKPSNVPTLSPTFKPTKAPALTTPSPTKAPLTPCDGQGKKGCNKLAYCKWKKVEGSKKGCVPFDCTVLNKKQCGDKKKGVCEWDPKSKSCIQANAELLE